MALCGIMLAAVNDKEIEPDGLDEPGWGTYVETGAAAVRGKVIDMFRARGMEGDELAVVSAMSLGEKRMVEQRLRDDYSKAGVAHILALSGTHLAIIYFVLTVLFGGHGVVSRFAIVGSVWCYVVIVGMPVSAVRAAVMLSMFTLAAVMRRGYDRMDVLVATVFGMLILNPYVLFDVGFQLSVLSVGGIIVICPLLDGMLPYGFVKRHHWVMKPWSMLTVSIAAQIATAPLVAYYFGSLPCWFVLSNLVAVPIATLLLYGTLITVMLWPVAVLQTLAVRAVGMLAWMLNYVLGVIAGLPFASVDGLKPTVMQVVFSYVLIAIALKLLKYLQVK
ncbi:MAG: ComEC/Rec2 family competence protein [Prevotella sp.]